MNGQYPEVFQTAFEQNAADLISLANSNVTIPDELPEAITSEYAILVGACIESEDDERRSAIETTMSQVIDALESSETEVNTEILKYIELHRGSINEVVANLAEEPATV